MRENMPYWAEVRGLGQRGLCCASVARPKAPLAWNGRRSDAARSRGPCATVRAAVPGHVPGPCPGRARGPVPGPCRASPARARPVPGARAECRARAGPRGPCPARARGPVPSAVPRAGPVPGHVPGAHLPCRNPRARRPRPPSRGRTVVQGPVLISLCHGRRPGPIEFLHRRRDAGSARCRRDGAPTGPNLVRVEYYLGCDALQSFIARARRAGARGWERDRRPKPGGLGPGLQHARTGRSRHLSRFRVG